MPWFAFSPQVLSLVKVVAPVVLGGAFKLLHERLKVQGVGDNPGSAPRGMQEVRRLQRELEELKLEKAQDALKNAEYRRRCEELDAIERARREYPRPDFLPDPDPRTVNIATFGSSGVGKSSLINALVRKSDDEEGAAKVGVTETTQTPNRFPCDVMVQDDNGNPCRFMILNYFDLPGGGTENFKAADYVSKFGLRYFDVVLVAFHDRVTETEKAVLAECKKHNIKFCVVHTRTDEAVSNNKRVSGANAQATIEKIRKHYEPELGGLKIWPVSVVTRNDTAYPLSALEREIIRLVWQARDFKKVMQESLSQEQFVNLLHPQLFPSRSTWWDFIRNSMPSLRDMASVGRMKQSNKEFDVGLAGVGHVRAKL